MNKIFTLILLLFIALLTACTVAENEAFLGFNEPDPEDYVSILPAILEYFHYRKEAIITGDMDAFYVRYPSLQSGVDISAGVNAEAFFVENMQELAPFNGDIHPEYYQKIRVRQAGEEIQVLLHGLELYLWQDMEGKYERSGGEFKLVLFMRQAGARWDIYRTDEVTLAEWKSLED